MQSWHGGYLDPSLCTETLGHQAYGTKARYLAPNLGIIILTNLNSDPSINCVTRLSKQLLEADQYCPEPPPTSSIMIEYRNTENVD